MAIEESKNLDIIRMDELMGSLKIFELILIQRKREKSIALKTIQEPEDEKKNDEDD